MVRKLILPLAVLVGLALSGCGPSGDSAGKPMSADEAKAIRGESLRDALGRPAEPNIK